MPELMLPVWCCWNYLHEFSYCINIPKSSPSCGKTESCFWIKNQFPFALLGGGGKGGGEKEKIPKIMMEINCIFHLKEWHVLLPISPLSGIFSINIFFWPAVSSHCNFPHILFAGVESLYQPQIAFFLADKNHFQSAKLSPFQRHL